MNRDMRNPTKPEYLIQVQLRFCLLETTCEQDDYFPPNVQLKVNGKMCQLPVSIFKFMNYFKKNLATFFLFHRIQFQQTNRVSSQSVHHDQSTSLHMLKSHQPLLMVTVSKLRNSHNRVSSLSFFFSNSRAMANRTQSWICHIMLSGTEAFIR